MKGETMIDLKKTFDKYEDEGGEFNLIKDAPSRRADLCAFILLDHLVPKTVGRTDILAAAEHDEIWIDIDCDKLAAVATEEDILYLSRCGVCYDEGLNSLSMFV
jgi:hypothetical protein